MISRDDVHVLSKACFDLIGKDALRCSDEFAVESYTTAV